MRSETHSVLRDGGCVCGVKDRERVCVMRVCGSGMRDGESVVVR